jgi:hypothetical protein
MLVSSRFFVVVGMFFEFAVDRFLFKALNRVQNHQQVGESCWIAVNPSANARKDAHSKILHALPAVVVCAHALTFENWIDSGFPNLVNSGALNYK